MTYSRFKDTSLVPRFPLGVGNKPSSREHLHTLMSRDPELIRRTIGDVVKLKALLKKTGEGNPDDVIDNHIDTGRLKDINNKHHQRQLHRNRRDQIKKKIIESIMTYAMNHMYSANPSSVVGNSTRHHRVHFDATSKNRRRVVNVPDSFTVRKRGKRDNTS